MHLTPKRPDLMKEHHLTDDISFAMSKNNQKINLIPEIHHLQKAAKLNMALCR